MHETWRAAYQRWLNFPALDAEMRSALDAIQTDESLVMEHFYRTIDFGTGGMRGELGPGTNRMNIYTIRKATEALARYLLSQGEQVRQSGVVIAYDSRHKSPLFAEEAAKVLGKYGIRVYLFDRVFPTPLLSFAVRHLAAIAGIVITASHNPASYNGYKVYGSDGAQITPDTADKLMALIQETGDELAIEVADERELRQTGMLSTIGDSVLEAYLEQVKSIRLHTHLSESARDDVRIIFTPLHGTTGEAISKGLAAFGYQQVALVQEQADPDPDFSSVSSPNPEDPQAFALAIRDAKAANADLIIGTDPDGDRIGVLVKNTTGDYVPLTGNQIGALLLYDVLNQKKNKGTLPDNGIMLKTIVTSKLGSQIARDFGLVTEDTLTGFKYIGEKIAEYEKSGQYVFQFGYEESYGMLVGDFVRDKDAVQSALLFADLCTYHKARKESLLDALQQLFDRYGFYCEDLHTLTYKGIQGVETMTAMMSSLRSNPLPSLLGYRVIYREDYLEGIRFDLEKGSCEPLMLPRSDVLKFGLEGDAWFCIRPSGTEPKIKLYIGTKGTSLEDSTEKLAILKQELIRLIGSP